jgi:IS30 family transposase
VTKQTLAQEEAMSSYFHFTLSERKYLQELLAQGYSIRKIASFLGRSPSSVSREISRNRSKFPSKKSDNPYNYHHWRAQICAITRRRRNRRAAIPEGSAVRQYVVEKLNLFWSPEQISMRWKKEQPGETLAFSSIYRYIRNGELPGIRKQTHLRRRGKNKNLVHRDCYVIHPDRRIPDWPEPILKRLRIGDWEGDTMYGGVGKGLLVTLVDRKTRFLCARMIRSRDANETRQAIRQMLKELPVMSLSLDNGSEFAQFREMEEELGIPVFFAEPHKPWQRGSNENMNGILRFFYPKGYDFRSLADEDLQTVVNSINNRPRKCLDWSSPAELLSVALD